MAVPTAPLTPKGAATRERIIRAAADLVLERGAAGTTLDDVRAATATSKSQLFHYFPGGKADLVDAIASFQGERVLEAQRPYLDELDSWESWEGWRGAVLAHYRSQPQWGCPIGALTAELAHSDPAHAADGARYMERWREYLEAGLRRMVERRLLQAGSDPRKLSLAVFAALQGGLSLTATMESLEPLEAALDGALGTLRASGSSRLADLFGLEGSQPT